MRFTDPRSPFVPSHVSQFRLVDMQGPSFRSHCRSVFHSLRYKELACAFLLAIGMMQGAQAQAVKVGGRIGPAFGFLNNTPVPFVSDFPSIGVGANVRIDVNAGLHAVVPLTDSYAVQPEVLFVQKGTQIACFAEDRYTSERYRFSYVQAHLLGRRDITVPGPLSVHAVAGLTGAVATGGVVHRTVRARGREETNERIALLRTDLMERWDVGGLIGVGLGYPVGRTGRLTLSLRYNPGFRTVFTDAQRPADEQVGGEQIGDEPSTLTRTTPPLRHDVILASIAYTVALR